jgi:hypothetical protein
LLVFSNSAHGLHNAVSHNCVRVLYVWAGSLMNDHHHHIRGPEARMQQSCNGEGNGEQKTIICSLNGQAQRSGDIIARPTRMLQFWSEMQQTWHIHYPMPQEQL